MERKKQSLEKVLEQCLEKVLGEIRQEFSCSCQLRSLEAEQRTEAGVHALQQFVYAWISETEDEKNATQDAIDFQSFYDQLVSVLARFLPEDIRVVKPSAYGEVFGDNWSKKVRDLYSYKCQSSFVYFVQQGSRCKELVPFTWWQKDILNLEVLQGFVGRLNALYQLDTSEVEGSTPFHCAVKVLSCEQFASEVSKVVKLPTPLLGMKSDEAQPFVLKFQFVGDSASPRLARSAVKVLCQACLGGIEPESFEITMKQDCKLVGVAPTRGLWLDSISVLGTIKRNRTSKGSSAVSATAVDDLKKKKQTENIKAIKAQGGKHQPVTKRNSVETYLKDYGEAPTGYLFGNFPNYYTFNPVSLRLDCIDKQTWEVMLGHASSQKVSKLFIAIAKYLFHQENQLGVDQEFRLLDVGCNDGTLTVALEKALRDIICQSNHQVCVVYYHFLFEG